MKLQNKVQPNATFTWDFNHWIKCSFWSSKNPDLYVKQHIDANKRFFLSSKSAY